MMMLAGLGLWEQAGLFSLDELAVGLGNLAVQLWESLASRSYGLLTVRTHNVGVRVLCSSLLKCFNVPFIHSLEYFVRHHFV